MMYKKVLEKLGLVENLDFALTAESFEMLPKQVEVEISHAVLDEEGNVVSPAVTEMQSFTPAAPSVEVLEATHNEILLDSNDIAILIEEYLKDKEDLRDSENDSLNIVNNRIYSWSFSNISCPTVLDLVQQISKVELKKSKEEKMQQIQNLEKQITNRRLREAVLTGDYSFIQNIEQQIQIIRDSL